MKQSTITTILEMLDYEVTLATDSVFMYSKDSDKENVRYWFDRLMKANDAKKDLQRHIAISAISVPNLPQSAADVVLLIK